LGDHSPASSSRAARWPLDIAPATVLAWPEVSVASPAKNSVFWIGWASRDRALAPPTVT
jgi:hypothetical protein